MEQKSVPCISTAGFERAQLQSSNDIICTFYKRCAKNIHCLQTKKTTQNEFSLKPSSRYMATHPPNATVRSEEPTAAREGLTRSSDESSEKHIWQLWTDIFRKMCSGL